MKIRDIKLHNIKDFINTYENRVAKSTAVKILLVMREVMKAAAGEDIVNEKILLKWHDIKLPNLKESTERRALTREESNAAIWVGHTHPEGLFLLVLYHLGLRRGEALGLMWGDFDLDMRLVHIRCDLDYSVYRNQGYLNEEMAKRRC